MPSDLVKIVKVGSDAPAGGSHKSVSKPVQSKAKKSMRTFPRGVLKHGKTSRAKIEPVRDPAKSPPSRKATLRILTEKGADKRRKTIKKTVRAMSDSKVRDTLRRSGLPVSDKTPAHIAKEILEGGMEAGMIVAN